MAAESAQGQARDGRREGTPSHSDRIEGHKEKEAGQAQVPMPEAAIYAACELQWTGDGEGAGRGNARGPCQGLIVNTADSQGMPLESRVLRRPISRGRSSW